MLQIVKYCILVIFVKSTRVGMGFNIILFIPTSVGMVKSVIL